MFVQRVKKYIGANTAEMNGVDAIVFTAGIGENAVELRENICSGLDYLGIEIDSAKNDVRGVTTEISTQDSDVDLYVLPTNEELVIARDTKQLTN
jgi:acetate kinase